MGNIFCHYFWVFKQIVETGLRGLALQRKLGLRVLMAKPARKREKPFSLEASEKKQGPVSCGMCQLHGLVGFCCIGLGFRDYTALRNRPPSRKSAIKQSRLLELEPEPYQLGCSPF